MFARSFATLLPVARGHPPARHSQLRPGANVRARSENGFMARHERRLRSAHNGCSFERWPDELSTCLNAAKVLCVAPARRAATESWRSSASEPSGSSGSRARSSATRFFVYRRRSVSARLFLCSAVLTAPPGMRKRSDGLRPTSLHVGRGRLRPFSAANPVPSRRGWFTST